MGYYVHITCAFEIYDEDSKFPEIAEKYLDSVTDRDASSLLHYAASGQGVTCLTKGSMFHWGGIGNYTHVDKVIQQLLPFFIECWETSGVLSEWENIVFLTQAEQTSGMVVTVVEYNKGQPRWESKYLNVGFFQD